MPRKLFAMANERGVGVVKLAAILVAVALVGCAPGSSGQSGVGNAGLAITLSPNVVVNRVDYRISGNGIIPITGNIDVTSEASTVSVQVTGIPAGSAYLLELTATSTDGLTGCAGQTRFGIVAAQTTGVSLGLLCTRPPQTGTVMVNGRLDNCPTLTSVTGSPLQTGIGGVVSLAASATDLDGDPITFAWTATSGIGTFSNSTSANTTFTCTAAGMTTLSVAVSDGFCGGDQPISVRCGDPLCVLDDTYTFSVFYGLVPRSEIGTLSPSGHFNFQRRVASGIPGNTPDMRSCTPTLPACGTAAGVDIADIAADLADPDVQAALAQPLPPTYGQRNIADATSFSVRRSDGRGFSIVVGFECVTPSAQCVPTPPGVRRLVDDLRVLWNLGLRDPLCEPRALDSLACMSCTQSICDPTTDGCTGIVDDADRLLCSRAYACFIDRRCTIDGDPTPCLCGTSGASCATSGGPNGVCLNEIAAAAKTTPADAATIIARYVNHNFPIGRAVNLTLCQGLLCGAECGLP